MLYNQRVWWLGLELWLINKITTIQLYFLASTIFLVLLTALFSPYINDIARWDSIFSFYVRFLESLSHESQLIICGRIKERAKIVRDTYPDMHYIKTVYVKDTNEKITMTINSLLEAFRKSHICQQYPLANLYSSRCCTLSEKVTAKKYRKKIICGICRILVLHLTIGTM